MVLLRTFFFFCLILCLTKSFSQQHIPDSFQLVYQQDFEAPQVLSNIEMTDPNAWRIGLHEKGNYLELHQQSDYEGAVRSPFNIAVFKDLLVGDFILEVEANQNGREYGHRDLCFFFGIKDASNFYYVHIASQTDDHANNIFLVNDEPRIKISAKTNAGNSWGAKESWHKVRIERSIQKGSIKVYFDDSSTPIMEAEDHHFKIGMIGLGSFDDTGRFDNLKVWAPRVFSKKSQLFRE